VLWGKQLMSGPLAIRANVVYGRIHFDIGHMPGQENMVGNMLFWPAMVLAFVSPYCRKKLDYSSLATKQATSQLVADLVKSSGLKVRRCMWGGKEMLYDLFTTNYRR
jgi:hypothetical protein